MSQYIIPITDEMRARALDYQEKIEKTLTLRRKSNPTTLEEKDRYRIGFLGELVFRAALDRENKQCLHHVQWDGMPLDYKFGVIKSEGDQPVRLNVCTASKPSHKFLAVPENKLLGAQCDGYIGIKLMEGETHAQIYGYISWKDLRDTGPGNLPGCGTHSFRRPLDELKPIEKLFEQLKDRIPT